VPDHCGGVNSQRLSALAHMAVPGQALLDASGKGDEDAVKKLIGLGSDPNHQDKVGWPAR
jgi:hypothetical protein